MKGWRCFAAMIIGWTVVVMACSGCGRPYPSQKAPVVVIEELVLETGQEPAGDLPDEEPPVPGEPGTVRAGYVPLSSEEKKDLLTRLSIKRQELGSWEDLRPALSRSLVYLGSKPRQALAIDDQNLTCTYGELHDTVEKLLALLPALDEHPEYLTDGFEWYRLEPSTLMTGYYEPLVHASPAPCPEYPFPVYGVPKDLQIADLGNFHPRWAGHKLVYRIDDGRIEPYHDRKSIDSKGALQEQGVEIAWVRDLVDLFFLQIQGSGRLVFPDGSVRHVLYAGKNGHEYVSLGRVLIEKGHMNADEMSMQGIRSFLQDHPAMIEDLLNTNPSYVFFRMGDDGPYGAMGATLTPLVSVASDPARVPLGSVLLHQVRLPGAPESSETVFVGLAQDKGGAIKGDRLDLFCGAGDMAAFLAGHMKERASVCILVSSDRLAHK
jgi:membrane-bound lytic murein transglycosylase A